MRLGRGAWSISSLKIADAGYQQYVELSSVCALVFEFGIPRNIVHSVVVIVVSTSANQHPQL
eukprot:m.361153 g.361153  ORF g.361153 m.361153 type:complete len:62 (+) comp20774_c0_seq6:659-844(+)